jgi:hypothetical protein
VAVYAYMTVPLVQRFGLGWLERGSMQVKFHLPFYDGEEVRIRAEADDTYEPVNVAITAERDDGTVCATALATVDERSDWLGPTRLEDYPEARLPSIDTRPVPSPETLVSATTLGTLNETLRVPDTAVLEGLTEQLPIYQGENARAHPYTLLALANQILVRNYKLGPWIHAASDLINFSSVADGEAVSVRGRIADCFERKGHEFVVLDLLLSASDSRIIQRVRHTAIYRPRPRNTVNQ